MKPAALLLVSALIVTGSFQSHAVSHRDSPAFNAIYANLDKNLRKPSKKLPYYHALPASKFPGVYLWDSAFISLVWLNRDQEIAKDVVRSVLHGQIADGRLPHVKNFWGTSKWTQPPVLSWAAAKIVRQTGDLAFAKEIYPKLKSAREWLWKNRRLENGLFFWIHAYESGIDNSPRFGARDESKFIATEKLAAVDLSAYAVLDTEALIELAQAQLATVDPDVRSRLERDIAIFAREKSQVSAKVRELLWDEASGYFFDRFVETGKKIEIPTIASFFPLTAGIATPAQAKRLIAHLANPNEFNTLIPFPTVARNHPSFEKDCWRGPVWVNTAYLALKGLERYGANDLKAEMAEKLVSGVYKTWDITGKFVEFYDPEAFDFSELTRKKGLGAFGFSASKNIGHVLMHAIGKQLVLGKKPVSGFVGWTGLVNTIVIEDL